MHNWVYHRHEEATGIISHVHTLPSRRIFISFLFCRPIGKEKNYLAQLKVSSWWFINCPQFQSAGTSNSNGHFRERYLGVIRTKKKRNSMDIIFFLQLLFFWIIRKGWSAGIHWRGRADFGPGSFLGNVSNDTRLTIRRAAQEEEEEPLLYIGVMRRHCQPFQAPAPF